LILIDVLSSACWEKKKNKTNKKKNKTKRETTGGGSAGHALLAVIHGIFAAVRGN
jgi:hypothetical protein